VETTPGADQDIDYTKENFTQNGRQYDLILAVNGYYPLSAYKRALTPQGIYVFVGGLPAQTFQSLLLGPLMSNSNDRKMTSVMKKANQKDLLVIRELLEDGKIRPVIDECYPLSKTADGFPDPGFAPVCESLGEYHCGCLLFPV